MYLELLKNHDEFIRWKSKNLCPEDTADLPKEFPCYARTIVQSWNYEEECAVYLYRDDVERMLADMLGNS